MLDNETLEALGEIEKLLKYPASYDHDCGDDECDIDRPSCGDMHSRRALMLISNLIEPSHESLHTARQMHGDAEKVFAEQWKKQNERHSCVNGGSTAIENILNPDLSKRPPRVTQHDATIAATVIQWLGTSCGRCFMFECERITKERGIVRRGIDDEAHDIAWNRQSIDPALIAPASIVADRYMPAGTDRHKALARDVAGAISYALKVVELKAAAAAVGL
jgi:hypothetical protein